MDIYLVMDDFYVIKYLSRYLYISITQAFLNLACGKVVLCMIVP